VRIGYSVTQFGRYVSAFGLAEDLAEAYVIGNRKETVARYSESDLLILGEFGMA
jgi:hypothetical protein